MSHRPKYWIPGGRPLPASPPLLEPPVDPPDVLPLEPLAGEPPLDEDPPEEALPEEPPLDDAPLPAPPEDVLPPDEPAPDPLPEPPSSPGGVVADPELEQNGSSASDVVMRATWASAWAAFEGEHLGFTGTSVTRRVPSSGRDGSSRSRTPPRVTTP
jgi:hypothetical protein